MIGSPARPIVLVTRKARSRASRLGIAPGLAEFGVFLPYSPLHHLLLEGFGGPLVATSGNLSGEPVITDETMAGARLVPIVDAFLHHDRPIVRPADDSVCRRIAGRMRRAAHRARARRRSSSTWPSMFPQPTDRCRCAPEELRGARLGAPRGRLAAHRHARESTRARCLRAHHRRLCSNSTACARRSIACDAHPGYASTRHAVKSGLPLTRVWHHHAHAGALATEWPDERNWLVFAWDGVGLGTDGTLWGGETFAGSPGRWSRVASFRPFRLPGGDQVAYEPWRSAASLCWETGRKPRELPPEGALLLRAWTRQVELRRGPPRSAGCSMPRQRSCSASHAPVTKRRHRCSSRPLPRP